ncbi:MAG: alpha/beta fold hydrolase [Anaerolineaceae bacterium]
MPATGWKKTGRLKKDPGRDRIKLYYEEMGAGVPLVIIHGFPFDHSIFFEMAEILKNSARVILPDLRGFGQSLANGLGVSLHGMAGDIRDLLDDLGIEKAVLGGHSMGGYLSLDFCRRFPDRVAGLTLIASHAAADTEEQRQGRFKNIEKIRSGHAREYLLDVMAPKLTSYPDIERSLGELILKTPETTLIDALQSMAERADATAWLKVSGIPVAMFIGEDDMIMPVARAEEMAAQIGAEPVVKIPASGHMLMMENPGMAALGLQKFLERILLQHE